MRHRWKELGFYDKQYFKSVKAGHLNNLHQLNFQSLQSHTLTIGPRPPIFKLQEPVNVVNMERPEKPANQRKD